MSKQGICLSCTFSICSTAEGCAVRLENDDNIFTFETSRHNDNGLVSAWECFSVQETGIFSVHVYEIQHGEVQEHISREFDNILKQKVSGCLELLNSINTSLFSLCLV